SPEVRMWTTAQEGLGLIVAISVTDDPAFAEESVALTAMRETVQNTPITATLDYGVTPNGQRFCAIVVPAGDSLDHVLEQGRGIGMPAPRVMSLGLQMVRAVELLHGRGIVHGDLRPSYVRVTNDDIVHLMRYPRGVPVDGM